MLKNIPGTDGCFVCGKPDGANNRSLGVDFFLDDASGNVVASIEPDETWCGYKDMVHGGIISAVMDDAMEKAVQVDCGKPAFTATLSMKYRKNVNAGYDYKLRALIGEKRGRRIRTKAFLTDTSGTVYAEAEALFIIIS